MFLIAVTNESNSSSLQPLYVCDIDRFFAAIRLNSVALDIPRSLAIQRDGRQISIKCDSVYWHCQPWASKRSPLDIKCGKCVFTLSLSLDERIQIGQWCLDVLSHIHQVNKSTEQNWMLMANELQSFQVKGLPLQDVDLLVMQSLKDVMLQWFLGDILKQRNQFKKMFIRLVHINFMFIYFVLYLSLYASVYQH